MDPIYTVLIIIFIVIFLATAALTLCALPGWVKIPNNYLKILFSSLILEVVASVFLVFNIVRPNDHVCQYNLSHAEKDWVCINEEGKIFQLSLNDSALGMEVANFSRKSGNNANYNLVKTGGKYLVMNSDSLCIGKIEDKILKDSLKFFDEINLKENAFNRITYFKNSSGGWNLQEGDSFPKKWSLKIQVSGAKYTVSDTKPDHYEEQGGFDKTNRKLHSFKGSDGAFYLICISDADNSSQDKQHFVTFIIIRTEIESKLN